MRATEKGVTSGAKHHLRLQILIPVKATVGMHQMAVNQPIIRSPRPTAVLTYLSHLLLFVHKHSAIKIHHHKSHLLLMPLLLTFKHAKMMQVYLQTISIFKTLEGFFSNCKLKLKELIQALLKPESQSSRKIYTLKTKACFHLACLAHQYPFSHNAKLLLLTRRRDTKEKFPGVRRSVRTLPAYYYDFF